MKYNVKICIKIKMPAYVSQFKNSWNSVIKCKAIYKIKWNDFI